MYISNEQKELAMTQQIEIEFKTMLTKSQFNFLLTQLPFPINPIMQTNHYFETNEFSLRSKQAALRIREKATTYTLTLKEPHEEGLLETSERLTKTEMNEWL